MSNPAVNIYVPIRVQAWIKNQYSSQFPTTIHPSPNYSNIPNFQSDVMPDATNWQTARNDGNGYGVYLHWTIPRGFRSGIRTEYTPDQMATDNVTSNTQVSYPYAPNRWLITRIITSNSPQTSKSWIVSSDVIVPPSSITSTSGNAIFPQSASDGLGGSVNIGRTELFSTNWTGENGFLFNSTQTPAFVNLQLATSGNSLFADYQPHCLNVFSIFDPLNVDLPSGGTVSYNVIGWYSSDGNDPLGGGANPAGTSFDAYGHSTSSTDPVYMLTNLRLGLRFDNTAVGATVPDTFIDTDLDSVGSVPEFVSTPESPTLAIPGPNSNTLFHGSVYGVNWNPSVNPLSVLKTVNKLGTDQIQCAVGTNSLEALSALMNDSPANIVNNSNPFYKDMFNAFLYGFANEVTDPNASERIIDDIYENSFQPSSGGTIWKIVHRGDEAASDPNGPVSFTSSTPAIDNPVRLTAQQSAVLDALNGAQNALDVSTRRLQLRLWEFFATWWQTMVITLGENSNAVNTALQEALNIRKGVANSSAIWGTLAPTAYIANLTDSQSGLITQLTNAVNTQKELIDSFLQDNVDLELQNSPDSSFWTPNDPSVVLSGLSGPQSPWPIDYMTVVQCRRDIQFLSQGFMASGTTINATQIQNAVDKIIAFPYQLSGSPNVFDVNYPTIASVGITASTGTTTTGLIAVLRMIFNEFVLLDPANTSILAGSSYLSINPSTLQNIINIGTTPSPYAIDPTADGAGTALPTSYAISQWAAQPWSPLFVLWKTRWFQTNIGQWTFKESNPLNNKPYYFFNGPGTLTASQIDQIEQQSILSSGRIIILPGTNNVVKSRLLQFTNEDPDFANYCIQQGYTTEQQIQTLQQQLLKGVDNWDILSQTLYGFNNNLITHAGGVHLIPNDTSEIAGPYYKFMAGLANNSDVAEINEVILSGFSASPDIVGQWSMIPTLRNSYVNPFQPVIHGQFRFHNLRIVDRFGQSIVLADDAAWGNFRPAISDTLSLNSNTTPITVTSIAPQSCIQIPPRILQPARINADWLTSDGTDTPLKFASAGNPICGWVLINYLDRALQIYNADGLSIGELRVIQESNPPTIDWYIFNIDLADSINPYLQAFITKMQIVVFKNNVASTALEGLFELLDLAFGSIQTPPPNFSTYASAIVGRPLVIARASWGLELAEPPYQSWNFNGVSAQYPLDYYTGANSFQMRLGSNVLAKDGLIGYFIDEEMTGNPTLDPLDSNLELGTFYSDYYDPIYINKPNEPGSGIFNTITGNYIPLTPYFYDGNDSNIPDLPTYKDKTVYTTLLLDPFVTIHAYTQILPVKRLELPNWALRQALDNLEAVFRMGPILVTEPIDTATTLQISQPSDGKWSWLNQGSNLLQPANQLTIENLNIRPTDNPAPYTAIEGFLKLNFGDPSGSPEAVQALIDEADNTTPTVIFNVSPTFNLSNTSSSTIQITSQTMDGARYDLIVVETNAQGTKSAPVNLATSVTIINNATSNIYVPSSTALTVSITTNVYPHRFYNPAISPPVYTQTLISGLGPVITSFTATSPPTNGTINLNIQGTNISSGIISALVTDNTNTQTTINISSNISASNGIITYAWTVPVDMISAVFTATVYDSSGSTSSHTAAVETTTSYTAPVVVSLTTDSNFIIGSITNIIGTVVGAYYDLIVTVFDANDNPNDFQIRLGDQIVGLQTSDTWSPPETAVSCIVTLNVYDATYLLSNSNPCASKSTTYNVYQVPGFVTLTVTPQSVTANLSWQPGTGSPTSYDIIYQITNSNDWIYFGNTTGTTVTIYGLVPSISYDFVVSANNMYGSGLGALQTVTLLSSNGTPPAAVTNLTTGTITNSSITLNWSSVSNVNYLVLYQLVDGDWALCSQNVQSSNTLTISGLESLSLYNFTVLALNSYGTTGQILTNIQTL